MSKEVENQKSPARTKPLTKKDMLLAELEREDRIMEDIDAKIAMSGAQIKKLLADLPAAESKIKRASTLEEVDAVTKKVQAALTEALKISEELKKEKSSAKDRLIKVLKAIDQVQDYEKFKKPLEDLIPANEEIDRVNDLVASIDKLVSETEGLLDQSVEHIQNSILVNLALTGQVGGAQQTHPEGE